MSTNAGNDDNNRAVGEQTNGDTISSQTKVNQEQRQETAATALTPPTTAAPTVTSDLTQTKDASDQLTKPKQTSTHANTDSTQNIGNKSGGEQPSKWKLKRFSTVIGNLTQKSLNLGNRIRLQQGRNSDPNQPQNVGIQRQDNLATEPQPRPEQGENTIEQHRATDLSRSNESLRAAHDSVQPTDPLSITTKAGDYTEQQQDRDQDDFQVVEIPELEKVSEHETEVDLLKKLTAEHNTAIASLKKLTAEHNTAIASLQAQLFGNAPGSPTPNDKVRKIKPILTEGEVTTSPIQERPGEGLVFRKADGISLTEVANLVRELNSQIDQAASLIMDLLLSREPSSSGTDSEIAWDELHNYLGSWLCNKLQQEPEINQTVAQIALQAGLVHACSRIINDWDPPFWTDSLAFARVYNNMAEVEGPIIADTWRAMTRNYMHKALREDQVVANKKYLEEVLLKLIIAVSGPLQSGEMLLQQCNEKVDDIARKAVDIHQVISREARSTDLSTFTAESGADFDQSRMEDTEGSTSIATSPSKVVCTVEMGLRGRKRVPSRQQTGDGRVGSVTLKAKVVLSATLAEL